MSRFVKPETCVLTLANGDKLIVKKRLNRGEQADMFWHIKVDVGENAGLAMVLAYLIDWELQEDNQPLRELGWDDKAQILKNLDPDAFNEIRAAIDAHIDRVEAEFNAAKKAKGGAIASPAILPSPGSSAGDTNGSTS
jgi:hypothetical protein